MSKLAVTIVTYKTDLEVLRNAVDSVLGEDLNLSIVVADNTGEKAYHKSLVDLLDFKEVSIIDTGFNGGYGYGHNYAEKHCPDSKYHLVMNADVVVHKGSLRKMLSYMSENSEIALLFPKVLNPDESLQFLNKREPALIDLLLRRFPFNMFSGLKVVKRRTDHYEMRDVGYDSNYDLPLVSGCFMLFDRRVFKEVGGFDERFFMYFEDFDICKKVAQSGGRISYMHDASITHLWERGSAKSAFLFMSLVRSMILYFNKWGWKLW